MNNQKKSIDGLVTRNDRVMSADTLHRRNVTKPKKKPAKQSVPVQVKRIDADAVAKMAKTKAKKRQKAADDFLKPVEAFDFDFTEDDIKSSGKRDKKGKKPRKKWSKKRKVLTIIASVLAALLLVFLIWGNALISKLTGGNSNVFDAIGMIWSDVPLKTDENGRTNILAFGTSGYNMEGDEGGGVHDGAQLTDSIMVISLNQETKDVAMVNIPRDLKVSAACSAGKINEVYWCNNQNGDNEKAGAEALQATVEEVLGIDIQYYAHVDWGSLIQIVDSIGGITVTLDEDINDYWTNTFIDAGVPTTLNGEQALGLARARHGTAGGDFTRGNSQQKILTAISQKIKDKGLGVGEVIGLVNALGDNLRTNFEADEIKTAANLLKDIDFNTIRQVPLSDQEKGINYVSTATIGGVSYVVPSAGVGNYSVIQEYIKQMFSNNVAVREGANIMVLNGSDQPGVAEAEKSKLVDDGFKVEYAGNADNKYSGVMVYALNEDKNGTKDALAQRYGVQVQTADQLPERVQADGFDFVIILGND